VIEHKFGFVVAPVFGSMAVALIFVVGVSITQTGIDFVDLFVSCFLIGSFAGILFACILGWPISTFFRHRNYTRAWHYCVGGMFCALPSFLLGIGFGFYGVAVGAISGYFYWWGLVKDEK